MADSALLARAVLDRLNLLETSLLGGAQNYSDITSFERAVLARLGALEVQKFGKVSVEPDTTSFTRAVLDRLNALEGAAFSPAPTGTAQLLNSGDGTGTTVTAPVVGQRLYIDPGPFSGSPTSYDYQVYSAGVAVAGATGTFTSAADASYLVTDDQVGNALSVKCHGSNGGGVSATTSDSAATSAVADINLTNAITALSRTSASGDNSSATGLVFSLSFGSNVYEGYTLRANAYSDGGLGTQTQSIAHYITNADLQSGATINLLGDGFTKLGATQYLQLGVEATTPHGRFNSFIFPTAISPTDAVVAMTFSATDKDPNVGLSNGNLTAAWPGSGTGSNYAGVRANRRITAGAKVHAEFLVNATTSLTIGIADSAQSLSSDFQPEISSGQPSTAHVAALNRGGATDYNGTITSSGPTFAVGDTVVVEFDDAAKKIWWAVKPSGGSVGAFFPTGSPATGTGGLSVSGMNGTQFFAAQVSFGGSVTANYGGTTFLVTPSSGFGAP